MLSYNTVLMALVYQLVCGPLPPKVKTGVDTAMRAMTPDQRWQLERQVNDLASHVNVHVETYQPSLRPQMAEEQKKYCDRIQADGRW